MSFTINSHEKTNRVQVLNIKNEDLERLVFPFKKHTITSLEYKPFSRFTLAKSLDEVFENKEQIAVSKFYEGLPKPWSIATQELLDNALYIREESELEDENES